MRIAFFAIFIAMIASLAFCARSALRSRKSAGRAVGILLFALIPPVIGNSVIIISGNKLVSTVGYYIYFLGMNCVMAALIHFADNYCSIPKDKKKYKIPAIVFLAADTVQLLCNPIPSTPKRLRPEASSIIVCCPSWARPSTHV